MKKVLLTGVNGFIGSYFHTVYKKKYKIKTFSFLNDNLNILNLNDTNTIVHLSALVHQMGGASKDDYYRVNVKNTLELAKKAKKSGVKHFIFMSTVKVYGEESDTIYRENTPCNPQDEYGKSKLKAEQELQKLESDNFIISIIRTPIVYGWGVKANIANLIKLIEKISILPFYNIQNRRSMVYIGNLCAIIAEIINSKKSGVFLANDDEPISTSRLINMIADTNKRKVYFLYIPFFELLLKYIKPSFYKRLYKSLEVDNSYSKEILNFTNPYSLKEGIELMMRGKD